MQSTQMRVVLHYDLIPFSKKVEQEIKEGKEKWDKSQIAINNTRCTICVEDFKSNQMVAKVRECFHLFCEQCIVDNVNHGQFPSNLHCPVCRIKIAEVIQGSLADKQKELRHALQFTSSGEKILEAYVSLIRPLISSKIEEYIQGRITADNLISSFSEFTRNVDFNSRQMILSEILYGYRQRITDQMSQDITRAFFGGINGVPQPLPVSAPIPQVMQGGHAPAASSILSLAPLSSQSLPPPPPYPLIIHPGPEGSQTSPDSQRESLPQLTILPPPSTVPQMDVVEIPSSVHHRYSPAPPSPPPPVLHSRFGLRGDEHVIDINLPVNRPIQNAILRRHRYKCCLIAMVMIIIGLTAVVSLKSNQSQR